MIDKILKGENKIAVIGLGYVGLPIALAFAKKVKVIAFDINAKRVEMMRNNIDPSNELIASDFEGADIYFTANQEDLKEAHFYVVAVPTPVNEYKVPELKYLQSASEIVGKVLKKGDYVIYESTVYPGCTEDDCLPVLEKFSGLKNVEDFKLGYSPERINPGDKKHTVTKINKVVSGCDSESLEVIKQVYEIILEDGAYAFPAESIKVAEAAKIIENTQRDLNIALMNEFSLIFDKMGINTYSVLKASGTKWNFLNFTPGLVGGHCIGVDPYYLTHKANELGYRPDIILSGRRINDEMSSYVAKKAIQKIIRAGKFIAQSKVLIMGITFKENVSDIRNSKVSDLVKELENFSVKVEVYDPYAESKEVKKEYGFELVEEVGDSYDCIIVAVNHKEFIDLDEKYFLNISADNGILFDIKNLYKGKINELSYWSL